MQGAATQQPRATPAPQAAEPPQQAPAHGLTAQQLAAALALPRHLASGDAAGLMQALRDLQAAPPAANGVSSSDRASVGAEQHEARTDPQTPIAAPAADAVIISGSGDGGGAMLCDASGPGQSTVAEAHGALTHGVPAAPQLPAGLPAESDSSCTSYYSIAAAFEEPPLHETAAVFSARPPAHAAGRSGAAAAGTSAALLRAGSNGMPAPYQQQQAAARRPVSVSWGSGSASATPMATPRQPPIPMLTPPASRAQSSILAPASGAGGGAGARAAGSAMRGQPASQSSSVMARAGSGAWMPPVAPAARANSGAAAYDSDNDAPSGGSFCGLFNPLRRSRCVSGCRVQFLGDYPSGPRCCAYDLPCLWVS